MAQDENREHRAAKRRQSLACLLGLCLAHGCAVPQKFEPVVLSYSEESDFCLGCPSFRVDLSAGGHVMLSGYSACAIPGEYHYRVPETTLPGLLREFDKARFFSTPRLDPRCCIADAPVKRLRYSDDRRVHEVVDVNRGLPAITNLEKTFREMTQVDRYLKPSVALYRELVQAGWNVNTLGRDHENALLPAVFASDAASVAFLLDHGATVSARALDYAGWSKSPEMFRLLAAARKIDYRSAEGGPLLLSAARARNTPLLRKLLDGGAPVNYRQPQTQETALLLVAAETERPENVRLLLERGADVNVRDERGQTPLFRAASGVNTGVIELLAAHGADLNIRDKTGRTALMMAAGSCHYWNVKALLAHGADPTIRDDRGRTASEPEYAVRNDPNCAISMRLLKAAVSAAR